MAETKRVSDQYTISAPTIIIDGNLTVSGSTTSVETTNSSITDNIIVLNQGESGAGITAGTSGIEIERGSLTNVSIVYDDSVDAFKVLLGAGLTNIRVATPVDNNDAVTKAYADAISIGSLTPGGVNTSIQFNDSGTALGGDTNFTYDGFNVTIGDTTINSGSIGSNASNADFEIYASGTGTIHARSVIKMENETSDPSGVAGNNLLYAKTPGVGASGVFFSNTTDTDELVSKSKAVFYGLIL
jgi:hypothetical protein